MRGQACECVPTPCGEGLISVSGPNGSHVGSNRAVAAMSVRSPGARAATSFVPRVAGRRYYVADDKGIAVLRLGDRAVVAEAAGVASPLAGGICRQTVLHRRIGGTLVVDAGQPTITSCRNELAKRLRLGGDLAGPVVFANSQNDLRGNEITAASVATNAGSNKQRSTGVKSSAKHLSLAWRSNDRHCFDFGISR